ncbi:ATP-dependent zinc metalloprotease FtsH [Flagellimonas lutaonensis]|uniref:ATP-dependent zinc metalloprotease FtsH n=1 Tax=Flagellimonas lutaonensis TaxID=516051 RepID=A0A0D5YPW1_9FLAO|nr:ATP-dependent zinc metalloprotease FtsH [Allomuricauda lutaonensis]AKA33881.1 ATPase AAA [Allomuricauda lutaonensis]
MKKQDKYSIWFYLAVFAFMIGLQVLLFPASNAAKQELSYKQFKEKLLEGKIERLVIQQDKILGIFKDSTRTTDTIKVSSGPTAPWRIRMQEIENQMKRQFIVNRLPNVDDDQLLYQLEKANVDYLGRIENNFLRDFFLNWIIPFVIIIFIWGLLYRRMWGGKGHPMMNLGKNKAKIYAEKPDNQVTFKDVAGVDEAVEEVQEMVNFLKDPKKYTQLGGKLPKGILLIGPPGTGKTLLAKAVAGEAGVPFFNLSGSEFVEMFVGVGAARVRDLFKQAKEQAPCIIFIDELDAIGKKRGGPGVVGGGYDERENTLNQLLVEMDGFDPGKGVIIMAATNRPEVLDRALLRPGRFDRQVLVDRPDMKGREAIFKVHARNIKMADDVDLKNLAAQTPGFAGAEIANVCNEAALLAVRKGHDKVTQRDFEEAIERVIAGLEKKNKLITDKERKIVAYHESGHAIVGYFTEGADEVQKVSIVPRGIGALGYTLQMPLEDRYLMSKSELMGKIKGLLGGRAAEEIVFGDITTGASNDLERVSKLARNMVTVYGMSDKVPNISLVQDSSGQFLGNDLFKEKRSEKLEQLIDDEVQKIIDECYKEAKQLLQEKRPLLEKMAVMLLEKEVLDRQEIKEILGDKKKKKQVAH